ncbi:SLC13 family permease [Jongsikchunia kroppenstedtii]|uniref:SLC13 family permease n=1 Tax=Jongsikchunia kroppenstedtii TaxID=1121721 RepID=UPI000360E7BD|nr:SLC13 family permease [Jongsikchunia kroppenstedtii]
MSTADWQQILPVVVFLLAITALAEVAAVAGLFDVVGHVAVRLAGGRVWLMWLVTFVAGCVATTVLSLDATAVLFTPVVIAMARQAGTSPIPFVLTTVWVANTGSLLLPVSNLSNLLALRHFEQWGGAGGYLSVAWRPALMAMAATALVLVLLHRRELTGRYRVAEPPVVNDRVLLWCSAVLCVSLVPVVLAGVNPAIPATVAALVGIGVLAWRARERLREIVVPWRMALAVLVVFVAIRLLAHAGALDWLTTAAGHGTDTVSRLRLAGVGAFAANAVNNLPGYLLLEPAATDSAHRMMALLVGVNAGPLITPWASLATLLWWQRCRRAGVTVSRKSFALQGCVVAVVTVVAAAVVI